MAAAQTSQPPEAREPLEVVVFDVNETLSDLTPLQQRFEEAGAPGSLMQTWFAATLRDGFALAVHDTAQPFAQVASAVLRSALSALPDLTVPVEQAVEAVISGFSQLDVHPDVPGGLRALADGGLRIATLSNGAASIAEGLLERSGLDGLVEQVLSVADAGRWKPHRQAYAFAAEQLGVPAGRLALVAVHPWDTDGAARAGWTSAWLDRSGVPYPDVFLPPDVTAPDLPALADLLLQRATAR